MEEYKSMKYPELQRIAKEKGIKSFGKKRDDLINELSTSDDDYVGEDIILDAEYGKDNLELENEDSNVSVDYLSNKVDKFMEEQSSINKLILERLESLSNVSVSKEKDKSEANTQDNKDIKTEKKATPVEPSIWQADITEDVKQVTVRNKDLSLNSVEILERDGIEEAKKIINSGVDSVRVVDVHVASALKNVFGWITHSIKDKVHTMVKV